MSIRTDMAAESFSQAGGAEKLQGVKVKNKVIENARLKVTDITIETQEAAEKLGRPVGRYITLTATDSTFDMYSDSFRERAEVIAKAIRELCGGCERFLAVGLGNYALTSDAVGPLTAEKIFATRHIKSLAKEIDTDDLGEVTVIQPGVLGNTGIESSEQVKAIAERVRPQAVIAVDALACSELSNLGRTIQLCNTGISPGSGVENARKELSLSTLGVKCIAIGVPTVIDLCTAAQHIFGQTAPESSENCRQTFGKLRKAHCNGHKPCCSPCPVARGHPNSHLLTKDRWYSNLKPVYNNCKLFINMYERNCENVF